MNMVETLFYLSSIYPLARAWRANRASTIVHALNWSAAAWLAWFGASLTATAESAAILRYLALCLTGCAGIAVLGARRPIVGAWNCVLLALLGVLLLPLGENAVLGTPILDPLRLLFAIGTVAVGVLNYLPTRLSVPAILVGAACVAELLGLTVNLEDGTLALLTHLVNWLLPLACWLALLMARRPGTAVAPFDREWLRFRDRFGLMWSQRIREQFNRAAAHASWPVQLLWRGLRKTERDAPIPAAEQEMIMETLREMLKRFGPVEDQ